MGSAGTEADERVHVRRLDVVDTLRWSWHKLADHRELVAVAFAVQLAGIAATFGVTRESPTDVSVADWVWPVYAVYLVGLVAAWAVCYLTAADAVAARSRALGDRLRAATRRVPALVGVAVLMWPVVAVGLALFVLPGVYLFHRLVLAYPACAIDGKGPLAALRSSWRVAGGSVAKIFGVLLTYYLLGASSGVAAGLVAEASPAAGRAFSTALGSVLVGLFGLAIGHLYLEGSRNA